MLEAMAHRSGNDTLIKTIGDYNYNIQQPLLLQLLQDNQKIIQQNEKIIQLLQTINTNIIE